MDGAEGIHAISVAAVVAQYSLYVLLSWILQSVFYRGTTPSTTQPWKSQPDVTDHLGADVAGGACWWPLCPSSARKQGRHRWHNVLATVRPGSRTPFAQPSRRRLAVGLPAVSPSLTAVSLQINLTVGSLFAGVAVELTLRGQTALQLEWPATSAESALAEYGQRALHVLGYFTLMYVHENVLEYYWHRAMHLSFFYRTMHRFHHFYKAPEPFDDLMIHPLEGFGYYCIMYSPALLYRCHWSVFFLYVVWMGLTGVFDHSGIKVHAPLGMYASIDHDRHHELVDVNFGFPHPFLDILHGTFVGEWCGWTFDCKKAAREAKKAQ